MSRRELLDALATSEDDLGRNRAGSLSERQAIAVRRATASDAGSMTGTAILLAGVMYAILGYLVYDGRLFAGEGEWLAKGAIVLVAGVLPTVGIGWAVWTWIVHARTTPRVETIAGRVEKRMQSHRGLTLFSNTISGRTFFVSERVHALVANDGRYRVCFVPIAEVVVAIEPVEE